MSAFITEAQKYRQAKKLRFNPQQIGGVFERIEKALGRDITSDEKEVLELLVDPALFGSDDYESADRRLAAFKRMQAQAAIEARKSRQILEKLRAEGKI